MNSVRELLNHLRPEQRRKYFPGLSDEEFRELMTHSEQEIIASLKSRYRTDQKAPEPAEKTEHWYDRKICGLDKAGMKKLAELEDQMSSPSGHNVDRKQLRYLKQLKKMHLTVPDFFRREIDPRAMYHHLTEFCDENDIPGEIVGRMVPILIEYIETGHMRPVIFVGEKGSGKTTTARMLVEEALQMPTDVIKLPQTDGGHGMTGDCGSYQSADAGEIGRARIRNNRLVQAFIFDEVDKVTHSSGRARANIDDELLSITDESCSSVYDNYLETVLVGLEFCPMFFTANDLQNVNPILADRCTVIHFPNADAARIKSISRKFVVRKMNSSKIYNLISFDYKLMNAYIDRLIAHDITSIRKYQQMLEGVIEMALDEALAQDSGEPVTVNEEMFADAASSVLGSVRRRTGFAG